MFVVQFQTNMWLFNTVFHVGIFSVVFVVLLMGGFEHCFIALISALL